MDAVDWDLSAVVRSCSSKVKSPKVNDTLTFQFKEVEERELREAMLFSGFPNGFGESCSRFVGLEELCNPFMLSVNKQCQSNLQLCSRANKPQQVARNKRRKKQVKKVVCQVPVDGVAPDPWSWRKYGQKPIKGSPFPRGYYRCSSIRGCPARKQVERNKIDPAQLIITYTSEHNHPMPPKHRISNSTATTSDTKCKDDANLVSSPTTSTSMDEEDKEVEEDVLMVEDMEMIGEDELVFTGSGESNSSCFFEDVGLLDDRIFDSHWLEKGSNGNATAAAC